MRTNDLIAGRSFGVLAQAWPLKSRWVYAAHVAAALAIVGLLIPVTLAQLGAVYGWPRGLAFWATGAVLLSVAPLYFAKAWELVGRRTVAKRHGFTIAGMNVNYDAMRTSILVTGVTGSSKTAGVLMPALQQLFQTYNEETDDELSKNEFQKIGAFIPEVKGDLVDGCIYLAHEAGRCVSRDVMIVSPSCRIPVIRYRDEHGRLWFLSGRGGAGGSDAGEILPRLHFPIGHHRAGRLVPSNVFESPAEIQAVLPELAKMAVTLGERRPRFLGWRWEGPRLRRVSHTVARDQPVASLDAEGRPILSEAPLTLTVDGVLYVDNGIHYNLVDPLLPAAEAAERITRLASMSRGSGSRGENDYFYEQGRKVIAACISLHRASERTQCTAIDIVRLATQDQRLTAALARLGERIKILREEAKACRDEDARNDILRRQIAPLEDLTLFFRDEWQKMVADGKTANIIKSTISGAFDVFLQDPNLAETFCQPSTFSFEDIVQSGKIIGLVPGDRYEQLGRLLGTACKSDFQSAMLARNSRPDLNSARLALSFTDECHKYIISGSSTAGDPYFMNLSRSNNVVNFCATQSYAWIIEVIGREAANVYISAFGVQFWLQQTDPETCKRASEICGMVTREKVSADHNIDFGGLLGTLSNGRGMTVRHRLNNEEKDRYRPEDFAHLNVGDIVAYNKGCEGKVAKVRKGKSNYIFCTEKPRGVAAVNARVREYYREILENLSHERGQDARWDCQPRPAETAPPATAPAIAPTAASGSAPNSPSAPAPANSATESPVIPRPAYKSVLPLTPGFAIAPRPVLEVSVATPALAAQSSRPPAPPPTSEKDEGDGGENSLTPVQVERERDLFAAYLGNLDAAVGEMSTVEPRGLAVVLEEARRQAQKSDKPAAAFGETLSLGLDGMASDERPPERELVAAVSPDAPGLIPAGGLALHVAETARQARAREEAGAAARRRATAERPRPEAGAFDLKTMRDLVS